MQTPPIVITTLDAQRLTDLIKRLEKNAEEDQQLQENLRDLSREIQRATIVEPGAIPAEVVTMNSEVRVGNLDTRRSFTWTIVYPEQACVEEGRISVLEPLGTALLGYRAGDELEWPMPQGTRRYRVEAILSQPEASGRYDL